MPGFELIDKKESLEVKKIFDKNNGILFAHGFEKLRKNKFYVREFENKIAKKLNIKYAQCVSSGTSAIKIALKSIGVKSGDEVITQSFNFIATVEAIHDCNAKPVILSINKNLNMSLDDLKKNVSKKTKAVIVVHMLGYSSEIDAIYKFCKKKNIKLIEDNCEALGGFYKKKYLGTIADIGILSFDFGKTITTGEGGCIITNNKKIFNFCRSYHDHGHKLLKGISRGNDKVAMPGFNYRMTEMQAAVGIIQLSKLSRIISESKKRFLELKKINSDFTKRLIYKNSIPNYDTFMFKPEKKKSKILKLLAKQKIGTKNIPGAMRWHISYYWPHLIDKKFVLKSKKCKLILEDYIAIPILLKRNVKFYKDLTKLINKI